MQNPFRALLAAAAIAALTSCGSAPSAQSMQSIVQSLPPMTFEMAVSLLQSSTSYTLNRSSSKALVDPKVRVNGNQLEIVLDGGTWVCRFMQSAQPDVEYRLLHGTFNIPCSGGVLTIWNAPERMPQFVAAWSKMRDLNAPESPAEAAAFELALANYRAAEARPEIGEDVRPYKVQAELAIREKRTWDAAERFEAGLAIAPWWPQGNFNLALVYGELGAYSRAVRYMQRYLRLVPDAANARAAQDKVYQWQAQAGR